jgi:ketosteroid isomerase-like protein
MSQSTEEVVRGIYDAFARADIGAILEALDEQVDWSSPQTLPHGGHFSGREGVGRFFEGIPEHWETLRAEKVEVLSYGDRVVALVNARGRLHGCNEDICYTCAHAWTLRDGKAIRFAETVDAPLTLPAVPQRLSAEPPTGFARVSRSLGYDLGGDGALSPNMLATGAGSRSFMRRFPA